VSRIRDLHTDWVKEPAYCEAYDALEGEFALAAALIRARADAGLTQEQLAERMGTKHEVVARWEGGNVLPSTRSLTRLAKATGTTLQISLAPSHAVAKAGRSSRASVPRSRRRIAWDAL
jgi:transcriptional regulator with XRE-family HTH domain